MPSDRGERTWTIQRHSEYGYKCAQVGLPLLEDRECVHVVEESRLRQVEADLARQREVYEHMAVGRDAESDRAGEAEARVELLEAELRSLIAKFEAPDDGSEVWGGCAYTEDLDRARAVIEKQETR